MDSQNGRVILLIDYDNFEICVRRDLQMIADLSPVVSYAQTLGTVVSARAYGSWDDPNLRMMVYRSGVEPAFAPVFQTTMGQQGSGKSVADTALVADGIDLLHLLRPEFLVVVSSDKDLMPLVRMARLRGTHVAVVGSDFTATQLAQSADRLVTYRELVGGPRRRGVPMPRAQQTLPGAVQPSFRAPAGPAVEPDDSAAPVTQVAPVAASPAVPEPIPAEGEAVGVKRRRRRRRGSGRADSTDAVTTVEESSVEETTVEMDLAEAINEADQVEEPEPEVEGPPVESPARAPMPPRGTGRASGAGGRLPFRRPEVLAQLGVEARRPEPAVRERPQPAAPQEPTLEPSPVLDTSPEVAPEPRLAEQVGPPVEPDEGEVRRATPPVGPIRAAAAPPRATEPEETAGIAPEPLDDTEIIRPPLESLLGRVIVRGPQDVETPAEQAIARLADRSGGMDPGVAMVAADLAEQIDDASGEPGRRRRRRRPSGAGEVSATPAAEVPEARPSPDPIDVYFDSEGAPEAFRDAVEAVAEAAPASRNRRRRPNESSKATKPPVEAESSPGGEAAAPSEPAKPPAARGGRASRGRASAVADAPDPAPSETTAEGAGPEVPADPPAEPSASKGSRRRR
ncbi:MAG: NYN domain-containing protein [Dehalococcoidia bacterium]